MRNFGNGLLLQVHVDTLVKKAYDNWMHVIEYDGKSLLGFTQNKSGGTPETDVPTAPQHYINSFDQLTLPTLSVPAPPEQPSMNSGLTAGGIILIIRTLGTNIVSTLWKWVHW